MLNALHERATSHRNHFIAIIVVIILFRCLFVIRFNTRFESNRDARFAAGRRFFDQLTSQDQKLGNPYAYDFNETWRVQVDFQSGSGNSSTIGFV